MKENISGQNLEREIPRTPDEKWEDISKRMQKIRESVDLIRQNMLFRPKTDARHMAWIEVEEKIRQIYDAFSENWNLGTNPEPEIYEILEEVEAAIKNFAN